MNIDYVQNLNFMDRMIFNNVLWLRTDSGTVGNILKFVVYALEGTALCCTGIGIVAFVRGFQFAFIQNDMIRSFSAKIFPPGRACASIPQAVAVELFLRPPVYKFTELASPSTTLTVERNGKPWELSLPFLTQDFKVTGKYLFIQEKLTGQIHYKEINAIEKAGNWKQLPPLDPGLKIGDWECKESYVIAKCWSNPESGGVQYTMKTITLGMKSWGTAATLPKNEMIKSFAINRINPLNNRLQYVFLTGEGKLYKHPCD